MGKLVRKIMAATESSLPVLRMFDRLGSRPNGRRIIRLLFCWIGLFRVIGGIFSSCRKKSAPDCALAVAAIVKNEAPYLNEWISYHIRIGVGKFYIFDNDSTDCTRELLQPLIADGRVVYHRLSGKQRQIDAYNLALRKYGRLHRYIAMIDLDEFIYVTDGKRLVDRLDDFFEMYPNAGGCALNWAIFGSSGYREKPDGLVTQTYLHRSVQDFPKNRHIKTVCIPERVWGFPNPHYAVYRRRYGAFTFSGERVEGAMSNTVDWSSVRLNHYFTKSYSEFLEKRSRGMADNADIRAISDFEAHDINDVSDAGMMGAWDLDGGGEDVRRDGAEDVEPR